MLERRYGLSNEPIGHWLLDQVKSFVIGIVFGGVNHYVARAPAVLSQLGACLLVFWFVRRYAQCEVVDFRSVADMAILIERMTDWLGADVCIDCVGCEASGSRLQRLSRSGSASS